MTTVHVLSKDNMHSMTTTRCGHVRRLLKIKNNIIKRVTALIMIVSMIVAAPCNSFAVSEADVPEDAHGEYESEIAKDKPEENKEKAEVPAKTDNASEDTEKEDTVVSDKKDSAKAAMSLS